MVEKTKFIKKFMSEEEPKSTNADQAQETTDQSRARQPKTPEQARTERLDALDQEINRYEGPRGKHELSQREEEIRQKFAGAIEGMGVTDETKEQLAQKMEEEIISLKQGMVRFREISQEANRLRAGDLISALESAGAKMSDESKTKVIEILSSPQIVHVDRQELVQILGVDKDNEQLFQHLSRERVFYGKYGKLLREQLVEENQEMFLGADIKLAGHAEVQVDDETIDIAELSDPEIADLGEVEIRRIIAEILLDKDSNAGQGMFWNVLVPKNLQYVLKTERKLKDPDKIKYRRKSLYRYPVIRDSIGRDFLLKQAVLRTEDSEQLHILQEKIPLSEMTSVRNSNIDALIEGKYGQEINEALKQDKNKKKLKAFIDGVEKLYREHKLMIDTLGDNLFFSTTEDGELDIKLVDYGAFKQRWEEPGDDIKTSLDFINKLKSAYL